MAQIIVNDEKQEVTLPLTLAELIKINKVFQPEMVTIQVNEDFVEREDYEKIQLKEGDRVDFLYFMGGGACEFQQNLCLQAGINCIQDSKKIFLKEKKLLKSSIF